MFKKCIISDIFIKFAEARGFQYMHEKYDNYEKFILKKINSIYVFTQDLREHNVEFEQYINDTCVLKILAEAVCVKKITKSFGTEFHVKINTTNVDVSFFETNKIYVFKNRNVEQCFVYLNLIEDINTNITKL